MKCANCSKGQKCYFEGLDCTGGKLEFPEYEEKETYNMLTIASKIEARYYMKLTRLEEIIEFGKEMDYKRIGLVFCAGFAREAKTVSDILEKFFKVYSVCCKVCGLDKKFFNVPNIIKERYESICNPVGQAKILKEKRTELNIVLGLCVGHDSLFYKYSAAPVTTFAVKDRVLAHNPLGAIYSGYYLRNKFK